MARKKLILVVSDRMDGNKKKDRDEHSLVRMSSVVRRNMGYDMPQLQLGANEDTRAVLTVYQAFSGDIKSLRESGSYTEDELARVGFVSSRTFTRITGKKFTGPAKDVWISDKIEDPIKLGADPEFLLFRPDRSAVVKANMVSGMSYTGALGYDGAMAEIRPAPSVSTDTLIANMVKIFRNEQLTRPIKDLRWECHCYFADSSRDYPVGGHIHVGNPAAVAALQKPQREYFYKVLNKVIDELLAIPMIRLDDTTGGCNRRTNCKMAVNGSRGYGWFGEMRTDSGRLENRTLSGMWLLHPSVAKAVFGTARCIITEVFKIAAENGLKPSFIFPDKFKESNVWRPDFDGWKEIPLTKELGCLKSSADMQKTINECKAGSISKRFVSDWLGQLKKFSSFKENEHYVRGLAEILSLTIKDIGALERDIRETWVKNSKFIVDV